MLHIMGREERKRETKVRGKACKEIRCVKRRPKDPKFMSLKLSIGEATCWAKACVHRVSKKHVRHKSFSFSPHERDTIVTNLHHLSTQASVLISQFYFTLPSFAT